MKTEGINLIELRKLAEAIPDKLVSMPEDYQRARAEFWRGAYEWIEDLHGRYEVERMQGVPEDLIVSGYNSEFIPGMDLIASVKAKESQL